MASTVAWKGYGRVTAAESTTGWTALKISGTGGGPTAALADGAYQGSGAVTCTVNKQRVALYFDIGAGNELDFTGGGSEEGQMVYAWANFLAPALLNTRASGGFGIFLASSAPTTTNYHLFYHEGSDSYDGGWKRLVIDPTSTVSSSAGSLNLASVRYFGVWADVGAATARFDNLICDAIDVGTGLIVTGTSTTDDWIGDMISNEITNRYGIITALNDSQTSFAIGGELELGDGLGSTSTTITDVDKKLFFEEPLYYNGSTVTNAVPTDFYQVYFRSTGSNTTSVTWGKKVGSGDTAQGRNGLSFVGNDTYSIGFQFDFDDIANTVLIYGSSFENINGSNFEWGADASHECIGNSFINCQQFDPIGGIIIRNCNFVGYSGTNAALLWNTSINIKNCNFIANTDGTNNPAGVEIDGTVSSPATFDNLKFSGNDFDILYSAATGDFTVQAVNGADPVTHNDTGTGTLSIENTVTVAVNVYDATDGSAVTGAAVLILAASGGSLPYQVSVGITSTGGTATVTHTSHGFSTGDKVVIKGANESEYNGLKTITVTGTNTYTYTISGSPTSPATGSPVATAVILHGSTNGSGVLSDSGFSYAGIQPLSGRVRKGTSTVYYKTSPVAGSVSTSGFNTNIFLIQDQ